MRTVEFYILPQLLWPWAKAIGQQKWCTPVALMADYNHTRFEDIRYHSLQKSPNVKVFVKFHCASIISPWIQISRWKLVYVTYIWWTLYPYQVSFSWHAWFLRYWNCLFFIHADPVTWIKVKCQQQWYNCVALSGGYNHTNRLWLSSVPQSRR